MRLTREKTVRISHRIIDFLVSSPDVDFIEDRDTIRQEIVNIITSLLKLEEQVDTEVRAKIGSQKKEILRAARSGTSSTASITRRASSGWASPKYTPADRKLAGFPKREGRSPRRTPFVFLPHSEFYASNFYLLILRVVRTTLQRRLVAVICRLVRP